MSSGPFFSIVVPSWGQCDALEDTVASIQGQVFGDWELLIIVDGPFPDLISRVEALARAEQRIRIHVKPHEGLSGARNAGIELANGEVLLFLDADDKLTPSALEGIFAIFSNQNPEIVAFSTIPFLDQCSRGEVIQKKQNKMEKYYGRRTLSSHRSGREAFVEMVRQGEFLPSACLYAVSKAVLERTGLRFPLGLLMEDNLFTPRLFSRAGAIEVSPEPWHRRRISSTSLTSTPRLRHAVDLTRISLMLLRDASFSYRGDGFVAALWLHIIRVQVQSLRIFVRYALAGIFRWLPQRRERSSARTTG